MRKKSLIILLLFGLCVSSSQSQGIRKSIIAGSWYSGNAERLTHQIDHFLKMVQEKRVASGSLLALIAPHAGYMHSGQTAAHAYSLIRGKDYNTVVILAPSHRHGFYGCSIYTKGGYETPFGIAEIDEPLAQELSKETGFKYIPDAHKLEHSVEIQVPFIQRILPEAKIVPIVMGFQSKKTVVTIANALAKILPEKKALVIASTDLSHFLSKKECNDTDANTISLIQSYQTEVLLRKIQKRENIMCGGGPLVAAMLYVQKRERAKVEVLEYSDSSKSSGDESRVIGYLAAALYSEFPPQKFSLSREEKNELLQLARLAINTFIKENKIINYTAHNNSLLTHKGAFVTLKKNGRLRGCIGFIEPVMPLYQTVVQTALYAACKDQRFPPVSHEELDDLEIEISVLSPLKKIQDPRLIIVGKHGLVISQGNKKGLLLPQVPVENNWSWKEFLKNACLKAGLSEKAWKSGADLFVFEAIVFH